MLITVHGALNEQYPPLTETFEHLFLVGGSVGGVVGGTVLQEEVCHWGLL